jgi:hypothetical protein
MGGTPLAAALALLAGQALPAATAAAQSPVRIVVETATVALTDGNACQATVTFRLKPGCTAYIRRGGKDAFRDVRAENVSCSISE